MNSGFKKIINDNKCLIDESFKSYFESGYRLLDPLMYATDGGKRIRATLYLETLKMLGFDISDNDIKFAMAIEMIHAYSLVHDDLPAMDDDDYRRGKESVHKAFGYDVAILTGDSLLNEAASLLLSICLNDKKYLKASSYLMEKAGYKGMVEGQMLDLHKKKPITLDYILNVHDRKTGDLFMASIVSAGLVSDRDDADINNLEIFSRNLGRAYQIQDDLLEDTFDDELNILNVITKEDAYELLDDLNNKAYKSLEDFKNNEFLLNLIDYLNNRDT